MTSADLVAVVLCGGRGTRAWPLTEDVPKPLLPVGDRPVLEHLVEVYLAQGISRFVLATGYRGDLVDAWARDAEGRLGVSLSCIDTGEQTGTGDRLRLVAEHVGPTFFATYGDGLGDVDLGSLLVAHRATEGTVGTVTTVPLRSQYGTLDLDADDRVRGFHEKPVLEGHWINAGFFAFGRDVFDDWPGPDLERDVLPALAAAGTLRAYRHHGFWKSMDTQKDVTEMTYLATEGGSPWLA
ncbi:MAG: glucose-phosphate cytidylyltransferase [Frankiales bacterium]|nr:glucose-phosphate cytidylyltransferase [Frankiales bacterium]